MFHGHAYTPLALREPWHTETSAQSKTPSCTQKERCGHSVCVQFGHLPWHVQCHPLYQSSCVFHLRPRVNIGGTPLFQMSAWLRGQGHHKPAKPRCLACLSIIRPTLHRCMPGLIDVLGPTLHRRTRGVCPNRSFESLLPIREHARRMIQLCFQSRCIRTRSHD